MNDDVERAPCISCAEPIPKDAVTCRFCTQSALVDVRTLKAIADGRARYQAARAVAGLGAGHDRAHIY